MPQPQVISFSRNKHSSATGYPYQDLISLWADKYLELEQYFVQHPTVSRLDPLFLSLLGDSVYRINVYNHALLDHLQQAWQAKGISTPEHTEEVRRFCEFHNDLVVSKVKHFFFKELPNQNLNELFFSIDREIYEVGARLWDKGPEYAYSQLKHDLGYYFYLLGLAYAFVYDSYQDEGVFLHFDYSRSRFEALKDLIQEELYTIQEKQASEDGESRFREVCNYLLPRALRQYMHWEGIKVSENWSVRRTYAYFVRSYSRGEISPLEPLSWHVFDLMGKIDGLIQDSLEQANPKEHRPKQSDLLQKIAQYLERLLDVFSDMYADNRLDWQKMYEIEADFLNRVIYNRLFARPDAATTISSLECLEKGARDLVHTDLQREKGNADPYQEIVPLLQALPEKQMKVESLLEYLDREHLLAVLQAYAWQSRFEPYEHHQPIILGFYSSGIFLAHMLRLFHPKLMLGNQSTGSSPSSPYTGNQLWMFKAYPYIAMHPLHDPKPLKAQGGVLICDESVKTGFTFSIFEAYSQRFEVPAERFVVQSVFEHEWYIDVETLHQPKIYSLFQVRDPSSRISCSSNKLSIPEMDLNLDTSHELLRAVRECICKNGEVDYTNVIADTKTAMGVACFFAREILAGRCREDQEVFLFSPSPEGRVLGLLTAFVLKLWGVPVSFDTQKREQCFRVLVDLSLVTGFTACFQWELTIDAAQPTSCMELKQEFDRLLCLDDLLEKD